MTESNKNGNGQAKNRQKSPDDVYFEFLPDDQLFKMIGGENDDEPTIVNGREIIESDLGGIDTLDGTSTLYRLDTLPIDDD